MIKNKPYFDEAYKNFWYDEQFVTYITNFMAVFSEFHVSIGKNDFNSETNLVKVPVRYGGVDRVVESIISGNTQNAPLRLPLFSVKLADVQMAQERAKGTGTEERKVVLPRGQSMPDGMLVMRRRTPVPYKLFFELNVFTSNELHKFQIMEQILSTFDPSMQVQSSDDPFDGGKINIIQLENINFEENYPSGVDKKVVQFSLIFSTYGWLQVPINFKQDYIKKIQLKIQKLSQDTSFLDIIDSEINDPAAADGYETIVDVDQMPDFPKH